MGLKEYQHNGGTWQFDEDAAPEGAIPIDEIRAQEDAELEARLAAVAAEKEAADRAAAEEAAKAAEVDAAKQKAAGAPANKAGTAQNK
jgi:hypothetical protein